MPEQSLTLEQVREKCGWLMPPGEDIRQIHPGPDDAYIIFTDRRLILYLPDERYLCTPYSCLQYTIIPFSNPAQLICNIAGMDFRLSADTKVIALAALQIAEGTPSQ